MAHLTTEETLYYGGREAPTVPLPTAEERMCADAAVAWRDATETVGLHAARCVVAEAFRMVMVRLRETEHESFSRYGRGATLAEQYGALIAGFEDVLKEMSSD